MKNTCNYGKLFYLENIDFLISETNVLLYEL